MNQSKHISTAPHVSRANCQKRNVMADRLTVHVYCIQCHSFVFEGWQSWPRSSADDRRSTVITVDSEFQAERALTQKALADDVR